jgi:hypothetical protein
MSRISIFFLSDLSNGFSKGVVAVRIFFDRDPFSRNRFADAQTAFWSMLSCGSGEASSVHTFYRLSPLKRLIWHVNALSDYQISHDLQPLSRILLIYDNLASYPSSSLFQRSGSPPTSP